MTMLRDLFSMFSSRRRPGRTSRDVAQEIYGGLVAQSRMPAFYLRYRIPDTVTGRFDMLCLHVFLLSNRLAGEGDAMARHLGQEVFDRFVNDVDRALREIGIGDTTVPKRKKRMIRSFYGQVDDFADPLATGTIEALAPAVGARFFSSAGSAEADLLAHYMLKTRDRLRATPIEAIADARLDWPDADEIM